ncbi:MAG: hypothetical protein PHX43_05275 [Alphaproteobacteria bacterium]|nr:hypothetical protein [Alphaproteobacteria bacterium]
MGSISSFFKKNRGSKKKQEQTLDLETLKSIYAAQKQLDILEQQFKQKEELKKLF